MRQPRSIALLAFVVICAIGVGVAYAVGGPRLDWQNVCIVSVTLVLALVLSSATTGMELLAGDAIAPESPSGTQPV